MTPELTYLLYAAILLIVHTLIQATFSDLSKGIGWALGPRDTPRDQSVVADRIQRALRNYLETFPAFIALATIIALTDASTTTTATGAAVYFWARVVYVPAYASGLPMARSLAYMVSLGGLVMMAWPLVTS